MHFNKIVLKRIFILLFLFSVFIQAQIVTDPKDYGVCDEDGDGFVTIPFSQLQSYALDYLEEFNESPEVYVTQSYGGIAKITNLYNNPQVVNVCSGDGGGYYDIAINDQQEIYVVRQAGIFQRIDAQTCNNTTIGQIHPNGQTVLALSFDKLNHLYEGGWTSQVFRADAQNLQEFHLWHDFGTGRASGDFVQIGGFLYVAWTMPNGNDYLYKVTLGTNNQYVSHENLGVIDSGTYGLATEYGRLYGNTPDYLYEINLETMQTTIVRQRPNQSDSGQEWWGAAGLHEALEIQITYHDDLINATSGTNPLSNPYTNDTPFNDIIFIRIHESTNNDTYIIPINIIVETAPDANDASLRECKDEDLGLAIFQLSNSENEINPDNGIDFTYFKSMEDLNNNQNPLPLTYTVPETTTIYVKVTKTSNQGDCYEIAELELIVPSADEVDYQDEVVFCLGTEAVLSVPDDFTDYEWYGLYDEDMDQPLNQNEVIITYPGNYSVMVTDNEGCRYSIPFTATLDGMPEITNVINNGNSITVEVSPAGQYEYSLNGVFWQASNTFYNIEVADYEVYIRDFTGCSSYKYDFTYFLVPNVITPNGDGYNDTWKIRGIELYPDAQVKIFDRYGKLFFDRKVGASEFVWDGRYLGREIPSGTYWYIITLSGDEKITGSILLKN